MTVGVGGVAWPRIIAIDDQLIENARTAGGHKTKQEAVTAALNEYVRRRRQLEIVALFGTLDLDPDYDYKADRDRAPR